MRIAVLFLLTAIVLFVWSALVVADLVAFGTPGVLTNLGLAFVAASFLSWSDRKVLS